MDFMSHNNNNLIVFKKSIRKFIFVKFNKNSFSAYKFKLFLINLKKKFYF